MDELASRVRALGGRAQVGAVRAENSALSRRGGAGATRVAGAPCPSAVSLGTVWDLGEKASGQAPLWARTRRPVRESGGLFLLRGSLSLPRGDGRSRVASLHFGPECAFQRGRLSLGAQQTGPSAGDPQPAAEACGPPPPPDLCAWSRDLAVAALLSGVRDLPIWFSGLLFLVLPSTDILDRLPPPGQSARLERPLVASPPVAQAVSSEGAVSAAAPRPFCAWPVLRLHWQ